MLHIIVKLGVRQDRLDLPDAKIDYRRVFIDVHPFHFVAVTKQYDSKVCNKLQSNSLKDII